MKAKILTWTERIHRSFWFIPSIMALLAIGGAFWTSRLDRNDFARAEGGPAWLIIGGNNGAREVLSTIAGSTITVAGVVFSITIVALSLAAQQYGPRLLRNFMQDRGTQMVLGTFTSVFVYTIIILRTVPGDDGDLNVPHLSVTISIALAILALGVLIYFIHHVSSSIQADVIIAGVGEQLESSIRNLLRSGDGRSGMPFADDPARAWCDVHAKKEGYIQAIDVESLVEEAARRDAWVEIVRPPGAFILRRAVVMRVSPPGAVGDEKWLRNAIATGTVRTPTQDVHFSIELLVEMAVRALSPSLNDPFTAMACIDRLSAGLALAGSGPLTAGCHTDRNGATRVVLPTPDFGDLVAIAFGQIRQHAERSHAVTVHLLSRIERTMEIVMPQNRPALVEEARRVMDQQRGRELVEEDRRQLEDEWARVARAAAE